MIGPRLRAAGVLFLVFAAGALGGVVFDRHHLGPRVAVLSSEDQHAAAIAELRDVLGLDEAQLAHLHKVLAERQQLVQRMWEMLRPEVQSAMLDVHREFAQVLRDDQRLLFQQWVHDRLAQPPGPHQ